MACYHKLVSHTKSHSWLWAQQTQVIDSRCFHVQLLNTTFLFTIIHEDRHDHFSGTFPWTIKLNHSVFSGSDGGSLWRLLCSLVHPKTQHLKSLFGADIVYLQQLQQVISNGGGGPQLLTQGCLYAYRAASQMGGTFSPRWCEQRENLKQLVLRDCLWFFLDYKKNEWVDFYHYRLFFFTQLCSNTL